ncbi:MAG: carboxypeptidase-like regulatory domain-containing protein [Planctomycetota bacterium]
MRRGLKYAIVGSIPAVLLGIVLLRFLVPAAGPETTGEDSASPSDLPSRTEGRGVPDSQDRRGGEGGGLPGGSETSGAGGGATDPEAVKKDPAGSPVDRRDPGFSQPGDRLPGRGTDETDPAGGGTGRDPGPGDFVPYTLQVVSRSGGQAIAGARVALSVTGVGFFREETDEEGEVSLPLPAEFSATVVVLAVAYTPRFKVIDHEPGTRDRRRVIRLQERAREGAVEVEVRDRFTSTPIRGAVVTISDGTLTAWDRTDGRGVMLLARDFFASPVVLKVAFENYHDAKASIREPAGAEGLTLDLFPGDPLTVRIRSPEGNPIEGGTVRLRCVGEGWRGARIERSTSEIGEAVFPELTTGPDSSFEVAVACKGYLSHARRWSIKEYEACRGEMTISLKRGEGVHGILTGYDVPGGEGDLVLELRSPAEGEAHGGGGEGGVKTAPVGPGGTFFVDALPPGDAEVRLRRGGRIFHKGTVRIERDGWLELPVPESAEVRIRVLGPDGAAVAGAKVFVCRKDVGFPMMRLDGETDAEGGYSFPSCAPGAFDGAVKAEGFVEMGFKFELEVNARERIVEVRLEKSGD